MPNQPKTPNRVFRAPDEEYLPAQAAARANGETVTDVLRRALRDYVGAGSTSAHMHTSPPTDAHSVPTPRKQKGR